MYGGEQPITGGRALEQDVMGMLCQFDALVSLCSGVMWVFILFLAAALKNAHCDFFLTRR